MCLWNGLGAKQMHTVWDVLCCKFATHSILLTDSSLSLRIIISFLQETQKVWRTSMLDEETALKIVSQSDLWKLIRLQLCWEAALVLWCVCLTERELLIEKLYNYCCARMLPGVCCCALSKLVWPEWQLCTEAPFIHYTRTDLLLNERNLTF